MDLDRFEKEFQRFKKRIEPMIAEWEKNQAAKVDAPATDEPPNPPIADAT
jgi:hypothetical protein